MRTLNDARQTTAVLAAAVLLMSGCRSTMGPKMPFELSAPSLTAYDANTFKADVQNYRDAIKNNELPKAQNLRNQIAYRVMGGIEASYQRFESSLTTQRAGFETGSDAIQLGMTAATTLVGAGDVKDILAASLSAVEGTRLSIDKNFFREKTTESLISQMRASRNTKKAQIITSLGNRDVTSYPWDAVWPDLVDLYYAGTVPSALVEIASGAGAKAEAATADLNSAMAQQAKQAISARTAYEKLKAAVASPDPAKAQSAIEALKSILMATGYQPPSDATASDLLALLRKAMRDADQDADPSGKKLAALNAAIAAANVN
jgi:hypothetical protein